LALSASLSNRLRIFLFAVALTVGLSACAILPPPQHKAAAPIERMEGHETFATAYGTIANKYIEPLKISEIAINGLNGLSRIDKDFSASLDGEWLTISHDSFIKESFSVPAEDDVEGWASLTFDAYNTARAFSPEIAAADASRVYQAIFETALAPLDRFSRYSTAKKARDNRAKRNGYGGIGLRFRVDDNAVTVTEVFKDSPAAEGGILKDDRITRIDGVPTDGLSQEQVKDMLRGRRGQVVTLVVSRKPDKPSLRFALTRQKIVIPTVSWEIENNVAHITISGFNRNTAKDMRQALEALSDHPQLTGIALDLRGNPGGLLKQAIQVADLLLPEGRIVAQRGRHPGSTQVYEANSENYFANLPIIVLVDGRTASAAEVLATSLQDRDRAVTIGTSSYGKGTVQTVIRLVNSGELILTWSRLIPPSGYVMHGLGVLPTICTNPTDSSGVTQKVDVSHALAKVPTMLDSLHLKAQSWRELSYEEENKRDQLRRDCPAKRQKEGPHMEIAAHLLRSPNLYQTLLLSGTPDQTAKHP